MNDLLRLGCRGMILLSTSLTGLCLAASASAADVAEAASPASGPDSVPAAVDPGSFSSIIAHHPASAALQRLFPDHPAALPADFKTTGITRADYLKLIAGNVDFFRHFQDPGGAIIDPYEHKERQYSTPAFALAAATLVAEADRKDLLDPATRALTFSIAALANHTTADGHADFYIPMVMHARRILRSRVDKEVVDRWDKDLRSLVPQKTYRDWMAHANWNLVSIDGESMRRADGLVAADQADAQASWMADCLKKQMGRFTRFGMYEDPHAPLAYDAFPRLWLEDMFADNTYTGPLAAEWRRFLSLGSASTLLLLSPSGEWPCAGRSANHNWNEAEVAVICEINAARWQHAGRPDVAGAFKRAAHLAFQSMLRWQRPSGELWITKNFGDPAHRPGYMGYSFASQYNLLPMGMLALAYQHADDTVTERPTPAESGSYVFDVRDVFHVVVAAASGTYLEINVGADPAYDSTGLVRIHRRGVELSPWTSSSATGRGYGPDATVRAPLTPGLRWKDTPQGDWTSLAQAVRPAAPKEKPFGKLVVEKVDLSVTDENAGRVSFKLTYTLKDEAATRTVEEQYTVKPEQVEGIQRLATPAAATQAVLPVLTSDGARPTDVTLSSGSVVVKRLGGQLTWRLQGPLGELTPTLQGPVIGSPNGFLQAAVIDTPQPVTEMRWTAKLEPAPLDDARK